MKRLRHVPLWAGTAAVLAFLSFPQWSPLVLAAPPEAATKPSAAETRTVLPIEGITCGGCAANVETALSKVPGVSKASVNYEKAEAVVMAAPSVTRETLARAVEQAGYRVAGSESGSTSKATAALSETSSLPILKGSLKPVIEDFNENKDKPRVLALLSPT